MPPLNAIAGHGPDGATTGRFAVPVLAGGVAALLPGAAR
jgi:hypothetical protein